MERMPIWQIALRRLEMPVPRFLALYVAPIVAVTFLLAMVIVFLTGGLADGALFAGFTGVLFVIMLSAMSALAAVAFPVLDVQRSATVSYTHLRAHETSLHLVCRLLLEKKKL